MTGPTVVNPVLLLRSIRDEARVLLAEVEPLTTPTRPLRIEDGDDGPVRVWSDLDSLAVFTVPEGAAVFVAAGTRVHWRPGTAMQWRPDWCALSVDEARTLGLALLAAAADGRGAA